MQPYVKRVEERLNSWRKSDLTLRVWAKDPTAWMGSKRKVTHAVELVNRLGWLNTPELMQAQVGELAAFAREIRDEGFQHVVLLGMGGSSLAPEVFMATFGPARGFPALVVLDSTEPTSVRRVAESVDWPRTLFLVSSKSGGTLETLTLFNFFYDAVRAAKPGAGRNFVAITDPHSKLEALAAARGFRRVFPGPVEVGGRYSALTVFGLVPAALIGVDVRGVLSRAAAMMHACHYSVALAENAAAPLAAAMGELALAGRDKLTFFASPTIAAFSHWVEQLIAESTGKQGKGIIPVVEPQPGPPADYGDDRLFVYLRYLGDDAAALDGAVAALESARQPVLRFVLEDKADLGGEFYRWEMATALVGTILGVNPFDQPDVEATKAKTQALMQAYRQTGRLPVEKPALVDSDVEVYGVATGRGARDLPGCLAKFLRMAGRGDYIALMAYLPRSPEVEVALEAIRAVLRRRTKRAVTLGYGPRFLHSTGQLHKGGPNCGLFVQITHSPETDVPIPGEAYSFGTLIAAQAAGDYEALRERGRRVMRLHLRRDAVSQLQQLCAAFSP